MCMNCGMIGSGIFIYLAMEASFDGIKTCNHLLSRNNSPSFDSASHSGFLSHQSTEVKSIIVALNLSSTLTHTHSRNVKRKRLCTVQQTLNRKNCKRCCRHSFPSRKRQPKCPSLCQFFCFLCTAFPPQPLCEYTSDRISLATDWISSLPAVFHLSLCCCYIVLIIFTVYFSWHLFCFVSTFLHTYLFGYGSGCWICCACYREWHIEFPSACALLFCLF